MNSNKLRRQIVRKMAVAVFITLIGWLLLTVWVEMPGYDKVWRIGNENATNKVLIVFDPDPIYNLDEQVCKRVGDAMASKGFDVTVATVQAVKKMTSIEVDAYVFCSNTYNWAPDWEIMKLIKSGIISHKPVMAITVGSGSTTRSHRIFQEVILANKGNLIKSFDLWLMHPNDETRMEQSNVRVATEMGYSAGLEFADRIIDQ